MKEIRLNKLSLENFKGHKQFTLTPNGQNMSIYGDNATGKTTINDAITWLLFGTVGGAGEKSASIKPLNSDGEVADHEAVTSVEAVFAVEGEKVTLKRTLQEIWTTKRGNPEPVYTGNASEYYVDGVPVKANAFKDTVESIVGADLWKLLTDPYYFAQELHWQKRREMLFSMAGTMTDEEIMATDGRFAPLREAMGKLSVEQLKAKMAAEKKAHQGARNSLPAKIGVHQKTIDELSALDADKARETVEILEARVETKQAELATLENNTAVSAKQVELREAQMELDKLDTEERMVDSQNHTYRAMQAPNPSERNNLISQISAAEKRAGAFESRRLYCVEQVRELDEKIEDCKLHWKDVNGKQFTATGCPTCGQALPTDQVKASKERFEADKKAKLAEIVANADRYKGLKKTAQEAFEDAVKGEEAERKAIVDMQAHLAKLESQDVVITDMDGYAFCKAELAERKQAAQAVVDKLQAELQELTIDSGAANRSIRLAIMAIRQEITAQQEIIGKASTVDYHRQCIEQLREDAAKAAELLAQAEKILYLIEEYGRHKAKFVEDSVNGLFRMVQWRLFREQANGGIEDRCDCTVNGVPWLDLNSGCKINAGLCIIEALSKAHGVSVPVIVDNAESVTQLENINTQIIRLVVSEQDKALRVVYHEQ